MEERLTPHQLLCKCLTETPSGAPALKRTIAGWQGDWDRFMRLASEERILPALWNRIRALDIAEAFPLEIAECLQSVRNLSLERNHHILAELTSLTNLLNASGIEPTA